MKLREVYTCPLELMHDMLKGKWKTVILYQIYLRKKASLSNLQQDINGISQKMLLQHLNELREYGLVDKVTYEGYPLRVEYFLTEDKGYKIIEALKIFQALGTEYIEQQETSQA